MLIQAQNLTRSVGDRILLDRVSLDLHPGQRLGLVGASGSGKSSLLRAIALLDSVDSGCVRYHGNAITGKGVPAYRRDVGYIAQRASMIDGTTLDNLRLPFQFGSSVLPFDQNEATRWLIELGQSESILDQDARTLSGGQQQAVAIVRTVLAGPQVLLLDEPTASLDAGSTDLVEQFLFRWIESDSSRSWIWTSHDSEQMSRVCDQVLRMKSGGLIDE
jgi:putative ABC transport system ATP-binding protein